jgi:hypothetical protein
MNLTFDLDIAQQACVVFVSLLFFAFVGDIIIRLFGFKTEKKYTNVFFALLIGMVICVIVYSVYRSHFRTINLFFILLVIPFLWERRKKIKFSNELISPGRLTVCFFSNYLVLLEFAVLALVFVFWLNNFHMLKSMQLDSVYYLKIAEALKLSGQENTYHYNNIFSTDYRGVEAYHFFEMWLSALLMEFSDKFLLTIIVFRVIMYAILLVGTVFGLVAITENISDQKKRTGWLDKLFSFLFVFFILNYLWLFPSIDSKFYFPLESNALLRINFRTYYLFMIPAFIFLLRKQYECFFIVLLILPLISITTAPAIYSSMFLLLIWNLKYNSFGNISKKLLVVMGCNIILIAIFYRLFHIENITPYYSFTFDTVAEYYRKAYKAVLYFTANVSFNALLLFLPFFLIVWLITGTKRIKIVSDLKFSAMFSLTILFCGIISFQLFSFMSNTYQFAFIGYVACALLLFTFIVYSINQVTVSDLKYRKYIFISIFCLYILFGLVSSRLLDKKNIFYPLAENGTYLPYSERYLSTIKTLFKEKKLAGFGGFIADSSYYKDLEYSQRMPDIYFLPVSYFIADNHSYNYEFCLSKEQDILFNLICDKSAAGYLQHMISSSLFYHDNPGLNTSSFFYEKKVNEFIMNRQLTYLILTKGVKPDFLLTERIDKMIVDETTGEQFVVLK